MYQQPGVAILHSLCETGLWFYATLTESASGLLLFKVSVCFVLQSEVTRGAGSQFPFCSGLLDSVRFQFSVQVCPVYFQPPRKFRDITPDFLESLKQNLFFE